MTSQSNSPPFTDKVWRIKEHLAESEIETILRYGFRRRPGWYDTPGLTRRFLRQFDLIKLGENAYTVGWIITGECRSCNDGLCGMAGICSHCWGTKDEPEEENI